MFKTCSILQGEKKTKGQPMLKKYYYLNLRTELSIDYVHVPKPFLRPTDNYEKERVISSLQSKPSLLMTFGLNNYTYVKEN